MVLPLARALSLLAVFGPNDTWLSNGELAVRSGMPRSTTYRIARTLISLGYLHYASDTCRFRLSSLVLALGYAAIAHSKVQRLARIRMKTFAEQHKVQLNLSTRDRLDMIVVESCGSAQSPISLTLPVGTRIGLASSPIGWALLAALPGLERYYLLGNLERRMQREWSRLQRHCSSAIAQVHEKGYCTSPGEWIRELRIIAVPLMIQGNEPMVLSCVGSSIYMTRARIERDIAPRLVGIAAELQKEGESE